MTHNMTNVRATYKVIRNGSMDKLVMDKAPLLFFLYSVNSDKNRRFMKMFEILNGLVPRITFVDVNCSINKSWCHQILTDKRANIRASNLALVTVL